MFGFVREVCYQAYGVWQLCLAIVDRVVAVTAIDDFGVEGQFAKKDIAILISGSQGKTTMPVAEENLNTVATALRQDVSKTIAVEIGHVEFT